MPLFDVVCANGHRSEVFKRGASDGPFACTDCGEDAKRAWSGFKFTVQGEQYIEPPYVGTVGRDAPAFIERMGGGRAAKTSDGGYRPALTHTAKCPKCARRRNVAIVNDLGPYGVRPMCEACGYMWVHQEATASDPLLEGYDATLRPRKHYSRLAPTGSGYEQPERAV